MRVGAAAMAFPGQSAFIPKLSIVGNVTLRDVRENPVVALFGTREP
ncbi:MAG TPA: hypothetical protein VHS97_23140 [Isosphaeraceae bacterium]|nr:hypothetical protein [Isosphaeraceae bacterium]